MTTKPPQCLTVGCTRTPDLDTEPPGPPSYYSRCSRCSEAYTSHPGIHAHRHRYTAVQCKANGYDPAHSWLTSTSLAPVVVDDVVTEYMCVEKLPQGGGPCPYRISAEGLETFLAWRFADSRLCTLTLQAESPHYKGDRMELAREIRKAYEELRTAHAAAFPVDVPTD